MLKSSIGRLLISHRRYIEDVKQVKIKTRAFIIKKSLFLLTEYANVFDLRDDSRGIDQGIVKTPGISR